MLYTLVLPRLLPLMTFATIEAIYAGPGDQLKSGDKILDLTIDLGFPYAQNCPPISHYRIIASEAALLRQILVAEGDDREPKAPLMTFSTDAAEPLDGADVRPLRTSVVGILRHANMWSMRRQG